LVFCGEEKGVITKYLTIKKGRSLDEKGSFPQKIRGKGPKPCKGKERDSLSCPKKEGGKSSSRETKRREGELLLLKKREGDLSFLKNKIGEKKRRGGPYLLLPGEGGRKESVNIPEKPQDQWGEKKERGVLPSLWGKKKRETVITKTSGGKKCRIRREGKGEEFTKRSAFRARKTSSKKRFPFREKGTFHSEEEKKLSSDGKRRKGLSPWVPPVLKSPLKGKMDVLLRGDRQKKRWAPMGFFSRKTVSEPFAPINGVSAP